MTTKDYLEQYHQERLNEEHDYPTKKEPSQIIKELEASIRKEVVMELHNYMETENGRDLVIEYALSKGITLK